MPSPCLSSLGTRAVRPSRASPACLSSPTVRRTRSMIECPSSTCYRHLPDPLFPSVSPRLSLKLRTIDVEHFLGLVPLHLYSASSTHTTSLLARSMDLTPTYGLWSGYTASVSESCYVCSRQASHGLTITLCFEAASCLMNREPSDSVPGPDPRL